MIMIMNMTGLGEDIYIAVNGSQTIFVTGTDLKIRKQINTEKEGVRLSPRYFAVSDNKVYVTFYEGYVGEILRDYSVQLCPVGPNPEGIAVSGGILLDGTTNDQINEVIQIYIPKK